MKLNRGIQFDHSLRYGSLIDSFRAGFGFTYNPVKKDPIDIKLADFINVHLQRGLHYYLFSHRIILDNYL